MYIVLFDAVTGADNTVPHGREGYFIGENGTHAWYDISKKIAEVLYDKGLGKSVEPTTFSAQELVEYFGSEVRTTSMTRLVSFLFLLKTELLWFF